MEQECVSILLKHLACAFTVAARGGESTEKVETTKRAGHGQLFSFFKRLKYFYF
jgi:hypothetical protein